MVFESCNWLSTIPVQMRDRINSNEKGKALSLAALVLAFAKPSLSLKVNLIPSVHGNHLWQIYRR